MKNENYHGRKAEKDTKREAEKEQYWGKIAQVIDCV